MVPKMLAYLLLVQKDDNKINVDNSPEPIKVLCNVNGSVSLRGVISCWPEWTLDSSEGTFYLLSAHEPSSAKFSHSEKLAPSLG